MEKRNKYKVKKRELDNMIKGEQHTPAGSSDLDKLEFFGSKKKEDLNASQTDDNEDEGLGDGNMGQATDDF